LYFKVLLIPSNSEIIRPKYLLNMKNKIGKIAGFGLGLLFGFLAIIVLSRLHPEEDFAGITIATLIVSGLCFAIVGSLIQGYVLKKKA